MSDEPRIPAPIKNVGAKFKGLPPWAYVAAAGIGGLAIWYGINRANQNAAADAADITGDYGGTLSATTGGDAYPTGSQGAGYYSDPTAGATTPIDPLDLLDRILPYVTGGGTQSSAEPNDHYTPPTVVVNIPDSAIATPPQQAATPPASAPAGPKPDPCKGEFPYLQDKGPRKGMCYKVVLKNNKRYRYYKNGDVVLVEND